MQSPNNGKLIVSIIIALLMQTSLLNAESIQLQNGDKRFPIVINFPIAPKKSHMAHPSLANSTIYTFSAEDEKISQVYGVSITTIPEDLGSISKNIAQQMVEAVLNTQITALDTALGVKGKVIRSSSQPVSGYPSQHIEVVRETNPRLFANYHGVFIGRLLVTLWANGTDTTNNRKRATTFIRSLQIKE